MKKLFTVKLRLPFDDEKDPSRALTWAYITAFGIIATLTIASHYVTAYITKKQKESVEVSYKISEQRRLAADIADYAASYYQSKEKLDYDFLSQSIREMATGHQKIITELAGSGVKESAISPALYNMYYQPPFQIDEQVKKFIGVARQFSDYDPEDDDFARERKATLDYIGERADGLLVKSLDAALEAYYSETVAAVSKQSDAQLFGALLIIAVLIVEGAFIFRPLIERIRSYHQILLRQALEDPLTGLNNRRAFIRSAEAELRQCMRQSLPFTIALCDLDHFKSVNDTYGHEVGDKVLQHFAGLLKQTLRRGDTVGRIGGEEFAIVLARKTDFDTAQKTLDRFCKLVSETPCEYQHEDGSPAALSYTVSMGFVNVIPRADSNLQVDDFLREADKGLYQAKEQGRNRVIAVKMENEAPALISETAAAPASS